MKQENYKVHVQQLKRLFWGPLLMEYSVNLEPSQRAKVSLFQQIWELPTCCSSTKNNIARKASADDVN